MKRVLSLLFILLLAGITAAIVAAQPPYPSPPPVSGSGYYPAPTLDGSNVIVIPPGATSVVDDILNNPAVLTPGPTPEVFYPANVPPNFLQPGDTVIVVASPLNVRRLPSTTYPSIVIAQLQQGEDLTILELSDDLNWARVDTRGPLFIEGWVSTQYIEKLEDFQPFAPSQPDPGGTGLILKARQTVNIRSEPLIFSDRVGILPAGTEAEIIGRKSTYNWWKIRVGGTVGWVANEYVYIVNPQAYQAAPILTE